MSFKDKFKFPFHKKKQDDDFEGLDDLGFDEKNPDEKEHDGTQIDTSKSPADMNPIDTSLGDDESSPDNMLMDENNVTDTDDMQGVKKKQIAMIIGAVAIFGLGFMAVSGLFSTNDVDKIAQNKSGSAKQFSNVKPTNTQGIPDSYGAISKYSGDKKAQQNAAAKNAQGKPANTPAKANVNNTSINPSYEPSYAPPSTRNNNNNTSQSSSNSGSSSGNSGRSAEDAYEQQRRQQELEEEHQAAQEQQSAIESAISFTQSVNPSIKKQSKPVSSGGVEAATPESLNGGSDTAFFGSNPVGGNYKLQAGSVIEATLLTGVNSDMGQTNVVAQVRSDVYDSLSGNHLLIPQGSRIYGKAGQVGGQRVGVSFDRIVFPNGKSIALSQANAMDGTGTPGLQDKYSSHDSIFYRGAILSALLGYAADKVDDTNNGSSTSSGWGGTTTTYNSALSSAVDNITQRLIQRADTQGSRAPTVQISPGFEFSIMINSDLDIPEYRGEY